MNNSYTYQYVSTYLFHLSYVYLLIYHILVTFLSCVDKILFIMIFIYWFKILKKKIPSLKMKSIRIFPRQKYNFKVGMNFKFVFFVSPYFCMQKKINSACRAIHAVVEKWVKNQVSPPPKKKFLIFNDYNLYVHVIK